MLTKRKIIGLIHNRRSEIRGFGIKKIGIFGSFVRSLETKMSDIDILVEFYPEEKKFDNYMELKFYLEGLFHRKVDLVIKEAIKPQLKPIILEEVVYA
jgi:predicted nucleotidyltransferase